MGTGSRPGKGESTNLGRNAETVEVPTTDAAIILSVTALLVALIILFLFQTPGLGLGIFGD